MSSLTAIELKNFASWLQNEMEAAQLQSIWTNGQLIVFQFYKFKELFLIIDTDPQKPLIVFLEQAPRIEKKQKPLVIFLNSHAKNLRWKQCSVDLSKGRVMDLDLIGGERHCHLQFQLIPKAFNLLVEAGDKKIAWNKPRELPPSQTPTEAPEISKDWKEWGIHWAQNKFQRTASTEAQPKSDPRIKALDKKKKALLAIEDQLQSEPGKVWKELGEHLKMSSEIPEQFQKFYDSQKSRSWNMEHAFEQAKLQQKKRAGTLERIEKLKAEIEQLEKNIDQQPVPALTAPKVSQGSRLLEKTKTKGRKLALEEGFEAVVGKSAQDNLAILRKAQPWDLWLHLKDYPGAHAIIIRPRQKEVSPQVVQKVSEWLIRESLSNQKIQWGAKYDVVVVECRFVRPIKGDKLGRVTYHHPQVYSFASKS